jgi:hypothetical protein
VSAPSLSEGAFVIRAGYVTRASLRRPAERHHDRYGEYAVSVFTLPDASVEEISMVAGFPNEVIRVSTVARMRHAGLEPVLSGRPGHAKIVFSDVEDATLDAFIAAFDPPIRNPAYHD